MTVSPAPVACVDVASSASADAPHPLDRFPQVLLVVERGEAGAQDVVPVERQLVDQLGRPVERDVLGRRAASMTTTLRPNEDRYGPHWDENGPRWTDDVDGTLDRDLGTTARLLALLSLLQGSPRWSGPQLADRLGVTVRTVRRDVERLRRLGYPVLTETGSAGGYRLGAGGRAMPPLMLDRDEAVAVAVCLRSTATDSIAGGGEAAVRALGKLEQLLPPTLRRQVGAIGTMTARLGAGAAPVSPEVLVTVARACRDGERLRVRYRDGRGRETDRTLDPHRLVSTARRWYLVAHDRDRDDWRTFRVDRLRRRRCHRPPGDARRRARSGLVRPDGDHRCAVPPPAVVDLAAPLADVADLVPPTVGSLEAIDARTVTPPDHGGRRPRPARVPPVPPRHGVPRRRRRRRSATTSPGSPRDSPPPPRLSEDPSECYVSSECLVRARPRLALQRGQDGAIDTAPVHAPRRTRTTS